MSQEIRPEDIAKKPVVYELPNTERVSIRRDVPFQETDDGTLTMDIYTPPDLKNDARLPAVVIVAGYPDRGFQARLGCKFKEMGSVVSWGKLIAASGLAAIAYTNRVPTDDLDALLENLRENAPSLGIDGNSLGLWAASGNVPLALSALMKEPQGFLRCAALCYGMMLDLDGSTSVSESAKTWGFANPNAGKSVHDLPRNTPLFIVRAGQDQMPRLNETIDRFVAHALAGNLPITFVNHREAPHAFDIFHDSETSRGIIKDILAFLRFHLLVPSVRCLTSK